MTWTSPTLLSFAAVFLPALSPSHAVAEEANTDGFANPELLVSTDWLAQHAGEREVRALDVRSAADYAAGHVPGSIHFSIAATYDPASRGNLGESERLTKLLGEHGISRATHVVLLDEGRSVTAARVFWSLEVLGHERVSVLDGGFAKWQAEERALSTTAPKIVKCTYAIGRAQPDRRSTVDHVLEDLENDDAVLVDARSKREYDAGRIPAAVRIEWTENYTEGDVPVFRSPADLIALYRDQGVTSDKRVHAY